MTALVRVDVLFASFCDSFSGSLREEARRLSFTLGFAPQPHVPWSDVFSHEVTLAAPLLVAEATPGVGEDRVRHALFAHALAVIDAMGTDRIADEQVAATPPLCEVLAAARSARDEHLVLAAGGREVPVDPVATDRDVADAIDVERQLFRDGGRADLVTYEALSERKQAPGVLASVALTSSAGWDPTKRRALRHTLIGVGMGLQLYDDVVDWEDDAANGFSWALVLAQTPEPAARQPRSTAEWRRLRADVHGSGVLARMLRRSQAHFRGAAKRAGALGAHRLSAWAGARADSVRRLVEREERHAGYVTRAHALAPWARAVLA